MTFKQAPVTVLFLRRCVLKGFMWHFCRTAEEKREMVKCIKEAIKRSIKAGYNLANAIAPRSPSFRRNNADDKLNASDPGPFLRLTSDQSSLFRRSFSHNPESFRNRRTSLESDATHSSDGSGETESISSATTRDRKYSLKKKNKVVSPLGLEDVQINLWKFNWMSQFIAPSSY